EAVQAIFDGLSWLGIEHDGQPVYQSKRAERHREVVNQMLDNGTAYRCYVPLETLSAAREQARASRTHFNFESPWRDKTPTDDWFQQLEAPPASVVRLKAPRDGVTVIEDAVQGRVEVQNSTLDDMILLRSDGTPTYMLAVVVDDIDMGVTHVIRGDDHLNNAFRQAQIYHAMSAVLPTYAHIPLIHDETGKKYSKRSGAVAVGDFADKGILSDAMINYLVKLGWGHGDDEIMSREQMIEWFDLPAVGRAPSRFDEKKLLSLNAHYLREMDDDAVYEKLAQGLFGTLDLMTYTAPIKKVIAQAVSQQTEAMLRAAIPSLKPRAQTLIEMVEMARFYVERPTTTVPYDFDLIIAAMPGSWDRAAIESAFRNLADGTGV
ncbi:MAG: glutamate--tRNA ligase, partial [Stutzerimonas stutzeri]